MPSPRTDEREFDAYAEGYAPGNDNLLKRLVGGGYESFIAAKVDWLLLDFQRRPIANVEAEQPLSLLDFGCGNGALLRLLQRRGFLGDIYGCDVSRKMLDEAIKHWGDAKPPPLKLIGGDDTGYPAKWFQVIVVSCVLHHIQPVDRRAVYRELLRILAVGGRLVIFEHNPFNPLTRWAVSRSPLDRNAVLLSAAELSNDLSAVGYANLATSNFLFMPPRFPFSTAVDHVLRRIPFGAQYAVTAHRKASGDE